MIIKFFWFDVLLNLGVLLLIKLNNIIMCLGEKKIIYYNMIYNFILFINRFLVI